MLSDKPRTRQTPRCSAEWCGSVQTLKKDKCINEATTTLFRSRTLPSSRKFPHRSLPRVLMALISSRKHCPCWCLSFKYMDTYSTYSSVSGFFDATSWFWDLFRLFWVSCILSFFFFFFYCWISMLLYEYTHSLFIRLPIEGHFYRSHFMGMCFYFFWYISRSKTTELSG